MQSNDSHAYFKAFKMYAKQRWFDKPLAHILSVEFNKSQTYFVEALEAGAIKVNDKFVESGYVIKPKDYISHIVHVHEPVYQKKIQIIHAESDFVVVNKPHGVASHPTTNYFYYSITKILEDEYGKMACINRLDVPTSGVLVLSSGSKYHEEMRNREIEKIYVAKVKGEFTDQDVKSSLKQTRGSYSTVNERGKMCYTKFKCIDYKNGFSLVECKPLTGRTHQIRVHLKSIGFPIVGDILYNEEYKCRYEPVEFECFGEVTTKGKVDIILEDPDEECRRFAIANCEGINNRVYKNRDECLCLHAHKYIIDGREYVASLPDWARLE